MLITIIKPQTQQPILVIRYISKTRTTLNQNTPLYNNRKHFNINNNQLLLKKNTQSPLNQQNTNIIKFKLQSNNNLFKQMAILTSTFLLLLIPFIHCWADLGHLLVARIAEVKLSKEFPEVYTNFTSIITSFNKLTDGRSNSFVQASLWADDIKQYKADLFDQYHFLYRIYDPDGIIPIMEQKYKDINVVNTIGWATTILKKNKAFISFERAFMARFLMNIVGQIHQPLNTIEMFNLTKALLKGDKGGKLINITTQDNTNMTLSTFVDLGATLLQNYSSPLSRPLNSSSLELLDRLSSQIMLQNNETSFGEQAKNLNVANWASQSYNLAVQKVYPEVKGTNRLTSSYGNKIYEMSKRRIALAGYRLANLISSLY